MKIRRRKLLQALAGAPAVVATAGASVPVAAAQSAPATAAASTVSTAAAVDSISKLTVDAADLAASPAPQFFSKPQFAALQALADLIVPAWRGRPSATQAGVPEFLDFLISQSPVGVQQLYRDGLDQLAAKGVSDAALTPLKDAWTYNGPSDPFARFLIQAKNDVLQATMNSREWAESAGRGRRGSSASNYYWRAIE